MSKIECIKDVVMGVGDKKVEGKKAFTKGKIYKSYSSTLRKDYDIIPVIRARNNWNEPHIIKLKNSDELDEFFNTHFKAI